VFEVITAMLTKFPAAPNAAYLCASVVEYAVLPEIGANVVVLAPTVAAGTVTNEIVS
jgi:hypothetical protein